jgi:hypothetical protein
MKKYNSTSSSPLKSGLGVLRPKPLSKIFVLSKEDRERIERDKANIQRVDKLQDLSQKLLKLFKSNETRVVELVASGEDTEATLILFFDKMTWRGA